MMLLKCRTQYASKFGKPRIKATTKAQGNVYLPFGTVLQHLQISHTLSFWPADSPLCSLKMNRNNFTFSNFLARRVHVSCQKSPIGFIHYTSALSGFPAKQNVRKHFKHNTAFKKGCQWFLTESQIRTYRGLACGECFLGICCVTVSVCPNVKHSKLV